MSPLPDIAALSALPRPRRSHVAAVHDALEARLLALAPARPTALVHSGVESRSRQRVTRPLAARAAQFIVVGFGAALLLALALVRGDGVFDPGGAQRRQSFAVSREGSGRVELPAVGGDALVRVAIEPRLSGANAWFWCIDAEPPLAGEDRVCASATDNPSGAVVTERFAKFAPGLHYFAQAYCAAECTWHIELQPLFSTASSAQVSPE
jgi:hypothetical protein